MDDTFYSQNKHVSCQFCIKNVGSINEFISHLRTDHCTKEGGSFICRYGDNQVCNSLPVEGVNGTDYAHHIIKHHILPLNQNRADRKCSTMSLFPDHVRNEKWTVYSASQNLPAVLNNPAKAKQKDFFTKVWGDSFVEMIHVPNPSYLPNITKQHFESYLKKTSKRLRRHSRISSDGKLTSENNKLLLQHFPTLRILKPPEKVIFNSSEIPDVFLRADFNLSCKKTFDIVFPHILKPTTTAWTDGNLRIEKQSWTPADFSTSSKLLQEKLSLYLDIVEVQIAKQVASKADAFFHTMASHDVLMDQLSQTITKVRTLREKIHNIKSNLVIDSLRILKGVRCRNNNALVLQKLKVMVTVYQTQPTVKLLLSTPDYVAALDLIYTTKDLLNNELAGILCFRHLSSELNEMINTIDTLMIEEFERYANNDLNRPLTDSEVSVVDVDKLFCIILGMLRRECFSFTNSYVKESNATIKAVIKQNVVDVIFFSECANTLAESFSLDEQLKLLTVKEWIILLRNTANSIIYLLKRIKAMHDIMLDAVNISAGKVCSSQDNDEEMLFRKNLMMTDNNSELFLDEENYNIMLKKLSSVLSLPCQYALERYSHLLSQKSLSEYLEVDDGKVSSSGVVTNPKTSSNNWLSEQATQQQLKQIAEYVEMLSSACDNICCIDTSGKMLRSIFKSEVGKFMLRFHYERLTKISLILESESWNPADVPYAFQQLFDQIYEFGKFATYKTEERPDIVNKRPNSILFVGEEKFVVIGTVLLLINIVAEYCVRAEDITLSASSLLRYVTELLHSFNSRSCRLVLGGEAVSDKTGKKKITSANLALLLRALQLLLWLVPKIQVHFMGLLPPGSNISSLERTTDELKKHIVDINAKLVSIVSQVIIAELRNWEAKPPVPSRAFQNISKYLYKFFGAISDILKEDDLYNLYLNIDSTFKNILKDHISRMNIVNNGGPLHGLVTQELIFYIEDLKKVSALPRRELNLESMQSIWR